MAQNKDLNQAKALKNDGFYTQFSDIEHELRHYKDYFRTKKTHGHMLPRKPHLIHGAAIVYRAQFRGKANPASVQSRDYRS